ncbi:peptidoglycan-binding protein [Hyphomicrobium sp.]|uniref:peptidoglycan-binding protein n=1 Tax=Hyphomicrobium sp. TaxID=82 RepID=UPI001DBFA16C|nr:peptidoglycan-binding protein [Hyphomicrobium sp.]MBY0560024.1 peptidoglycan-binding protein [Hyphomicrobium sp.]
MVTKNELFRLAPGARHDLVQAIVDNWGVAVAAGLTKPRRIRQFLANICAETGGLSILEESMNYRTTARLRQIWPTRFKTNAAAAPFVGQPIKLAQKVYGGRMGNAPAPSLDGWTYRGGGMMQTTGREGYRDIGFENNPDALRKDPAIAFKTAVQEWVDYKLNPAADRYDTVAVRKRINGGLNGIAEVRHFLQVAEGIWPDDARLVTEYTSQTPAQADTAAKLERERVRAVQKRLIKLGYTEVGEADGLNGKFTRAAILAFRDDNGLPPGDIDDTLKQALATAPKRRIADDLPNLSAKAARRLAPELKANFITKIFSAFSAITAAISAFFKGVLDQFADAKSMVEPLQEYLYDVPGWVWLSIVFSASVGLWLVAHKGEVEGIEAVRTGKRR